MSSLLLHEPICGVPGCASWERDKRTWDDWKDYGPSNTENDPRVARRAAFNKLSRTRAFHDLVTFFEGFIREIRHREQEEELQAKKELAQWMDDDDCIDNDSTFLRGRVPATEGDPSARAVAASEPLPAIERSPFPAVSLASTAGGGACAAADAPVEHHDDVEPQSTPPAAAPCTTAIPLCIPNETTVQGRPAGTSTPASSRKQTRSTWEGPSDDENGETASGCVLPASQKPRISPSPDDEHPAADPPQQALDHLQPS
jgi:hypothetical protein